MYNPWGESRIGSFIVTGVRKIRIGRFQQPPCFHSSKYVLILITDSKCISGINLYKGTACVLKTCDKHCKLHNEVSSILKIRCRSQKLKYT